MTAAQAAFARLNFAAANAEDARAFVVCDHDGEMHTWPAQCWNHTHGSFYVPGAPDGMIFVQGTLVTLTGTRPLNAVILTGLLREVPDARHAPAARALVQRLNTGESDPRLRALLYHVMAWAPRPHLAAPARALASGWSLDAVLRRQELWP